jgi:hypothetical protein
MPFSSNRFLILLRNFTIRLDICDRMMRAIRIPKTLIPEAVSQTAIVLNLSGMDTLLNQRQISKFLPAISRQMTNKPHFLKFAMNHVRFMMGPKLHAVQEALSFGIARI